MYFSRIRIRSREVTTGQLASWFRQSAYGDHKLVWRFFADVKGPNGVRDFVFRKEQTGQEFPCFYVVSGEKPVDASGMWRIETKEYNPKLRVGQVLNFSVRMNPVVTRSRRTARHDVVMDAKKKMNYSSLSKSERPRNAELVQDVGGKWLQSRCKGWGFSVVDVLADGYVSHNRGYKRGQQKPICYTTLDYSGVLRVENSDRFLESLFLGIGREKAMGCGLLMVKRVD